MKRGHFIAFFIIILLFISGATSCQTGKKTVTGGRYIGGTDGLTATFSDGEPPENVLDDNNEQFTITLFLENEGESDIKEGDVKTTITGISKKAFSISDLTKTSGSLIEGERKEGTSTIKGGEDYISYDAKYKDNLFADYIATVGINYCYIYKTKAVADVCLRKNVVSRVKETDACKVTEDKAVSSSGAPIQITSLKERVSKENEISVTFTIENKGDGDVFNYGSFIGKDCVESEEKDSKNYVHIKVSSQEGLEIKCNKFDDKPDGKVRLVEKLATVTCKIKTGGLQETSYTSPLDIDVDYVYKDFVSKTLTVENSV